MLAGCPTACEIESTRAAQPPACGDQTPTTKTLAALLTAPYADGQTWTRTDEVGERIRLIDEVEAVTTREFRRVPSPGASDFEIRTFADGSLIAFVGSYWDLVVEIDAGSAWHTADNDGNARIGIGERYDRELPSTEDDSETDWDSIPA